MIGLADYRSGTTTRNSLVRKVENITYVPERKQSDILKEIHGEEAALDEPEVPISSTPEQVISYFEEIISNTKDRNKIHVFTLAIKWIRELEQRKRDEIAEKVKSFSQKKDEEELLKAVEIE